MTCSALSFAKWSWLGICGPWERRVTGYGLATLAKQLNSEAITE